MNGDILFTLNARAQNDPFFPEAVRLLAEHAPLVSITGKDVETLDPARVAKARAWVVAGGDGTLHHAVNSLLRLPAKERCPIWYLPFGTGNDFARTMGLSEVEPLALLGAALKGHGHTQPVAAGRCNDRYFLNMASGGIFASVTVEANAQLKGLAGRWSYFVSGIGKLLERDHFRVSVNGEKAEKAIGFFVGNAKFAGGGIQITAEASPFDDTLEFLLVPDLSNADLLALGIELQKETPDLTAHPVRRETVRELALEFSQAVDVNLDGEPVRIREAKFSVVADAVRLFVPKGAGA